jgi:signal transduction histidine kinase
MVAVEAGPRAIAPHPDDGPLLAALSRRGAGAAGLVVAFALGHALLMQLGYSLKTSIADPAVMWPAAGLAFVTLWLTPRRLWPVLLATQFAVEVATAAFWMSSFRPGQVTLYTFANMAGALVAASLASWQLRERVLLRARELLWFVAVTAAGAIVSALIGAAVHAAALGGGFSLAQYLQLLQIWAAGQWAGILCIAPLIAFWFSPMRDRHPQLRLRSRIELGLLALLLFAACVNVSGWQQGAATSLLQLPTVIVLLMIIAIMRVPPRWVVSLYALVSLTLAVLLAQGSTQPTATTLFHDVGQLQMFLVTLAVFAFALSVTLAERSITARLLRDSENRYRSFVELSTETLWRIELVRPMPASLPPTQQLAWLREHARVAEFSHSYELLDPQAAGAEGSLPWRPDLSWTAAFETQLERAAAQSWSIQSLRFQVQLADWRHTYLASFCGETQDGQLLRIWGVARDITELVELNANLLFERERLKSFARQLTSAEEKARRATAVDLHDDIGQSLAGMAMTLDVARHSASPEVKLLIEEVRTQLRGVQERTRNMVSYLSPPGLYELGLKPALQWLAVYVRTHDKLQVQLDAELREDAIRLDTRVLVFKLVRELLRNVVKHSGVDAARVMVRGNSELLQIEVSDQGKGFEWQMDMFGASSGGFGLWSVADQVNEAGGQITVDAAPGRGATIELAFPLRIATESRDVRQGTDHTRSA